MANNDVEIEIKIPLDENTFSEVKNKLKGIDRNRGNKRFWKRRRNKGKTF